MRQNSPLKMLEGSDRLPELPKKLNKREADITPWVLAHFRTRFAPCFVYKISDEARRRVPFDAFMLAGTDKDTNSSLSAAIEIKATDRKYISEGAVLPHQKLALLEAAKSGAHAYVVAAFLHKDARVVIAIDIRKWAGATPSTIGEFSFDL